ASDAVAPGDGAFNTCNALPVTEIIKSSTSAPCEEIACALTPLPPGCKSPSVNSGSKRCNAARNACLLKERNIAPRQVRQYVRAILRKPENVKVSRKSRASKSLFL